MSQVMLPVGLLSTPGMLIAFFLVLSAAKVNGDLVDQDGLRKSRQLDLGLQDIRNADVETTTTVALTSSRRDGEISDYLPPVSSTLSEERVGAQSQQAFDFKSVNSVERENELCKPPFDQDSCDFKDSSASDSKIPKPSRDLVPPFNDLEQELANKATTLFERTDEEMKTTTETQTRLFTTAITPTTTEKATTVILKSAPSETIAREIRTTTKPRPFASTAEATNELRSYLPPQPEFSAAAQTNVAVVQPANQNDHRDHDHLHGHHHGENFNICDDAFHSFLCAPLKARKRITGALPSSLLGQSSFINYQKALKSPDRETASSNTFSNEYLPPKLSPTNLIQSSYLPPFTTRKSTTTTTTARPYSPSKFTPESSNSNERLYIPPLIENPRVKPAPTNQAFSTIISSTTLTPLISSTGVGSDSDTIPFVSPTIPVFNSLSSHENNFYLPPDSNPQPAASFVTTSKNVFPITSTLPPSTVAPLPVATHFGPLSSNSIFLSKKPKAEPVFTTINPPPTSFPTAFPTTTKPITHFPSFSSQPSSPRGSYLPPSQPVTTTVKPYTKGFKFSEQSSKADRSYLPPDLEEPAAAQISSAAVAAPQMKNPFHHGRDLCTDPFHSFLCVSAKPRKRITGQLPSGFKPENSNTNELRLKPEPSNQDESRVRADEPLRGAPAQNVGYKYPKPINPLPTPSNALTSTAAPSTGYSYPKPEKLFPLPSQDVKLITPSTTKKPALIPSEVRAIAGYEYPKPQKIFPIPTLQENTKVIMTTRPSTAGYSYAKQQKQLPLPTEQKEVRQKPKPKVAPFATLSIPLPTNTVKGYQYPKPEQSLQLPEKEGYSYPKPDKRLELPTESRLRHKLPQSSSNLEVLGNLGSAEFIPVNKIGEKRAESSKLISGLRRFGERMKKREREAQIYRKQSHKHEE